MFESHFLKAIVSYITAVVGLEEESGWVYVFLKSYVCLKVISRSHAASLLKIPDALGNIDSIQLMHIICYV